MLAVTFVVSAPTYYLVEEPYDYDYYTYGASGIYREDAVVVAEAAPYDRCFLSS